MAELIIGLTRVVPLRNDILPRKASPAGPGRTGWQ
jgi:hypothetical protein